MSEIKWEAPPDQQRGPTPGHPQRMRQFVEVLKERPGEWAIYPHSRMASMATRLKQRYGCETRTVGMASDCTIYARWMGEAS